MFVTKIINRHKKNNKLQKNSPHDLALLRFDGIIVIFNSEIQTGKTFKFIYDPCAKDPIITENNIK